MGSLLSYILVCKLIIYPSVSYGSFFYKTCKVVFILYNDDLNTVSTGFICSGGGICGFDLVSVQAFFIWHYQKVPQCFFLVCAPWARSNG